MLWLVGKLWWVNSYILSLSSTVIFKIKISRYFFKWKLTVNFNFLYSPHSPVPRNSRTPFYRRSQLYLFWILDSKFQIVKWTFEIESMKKIVKGLITYMSCTIEYAQEHTLWFWKKEKLKVRIVLNLSKCALHSFKAITVTTINVYL